MTDQDKPRRKNIAVNSKAEAVVKTKKKKPQITQMKQKPAEKTVHPQIAPIAQIQPKAVAAWDSEPRASASGSPSTGNRSLTIAALTDCAFPGW